MVVVELALSVSAKDGQSYCLNVMGYLSGRACPASSSGSKSDLARHSISMLYF